MQALTPGFHKCVRDPVSAISVFGGLLASVAFEFSDSELSLLVFHCIIIYFYQAPTCLNWACHTL